MAEKVIWLEDFWLEVHPYPHPSPEPQGSNMPVIDIAAQNFSHISKYLCVVMLSD